jgi:hypothetical protein
MSIPFDIPSQHHGAFIAGQIIRKGATLRDSKTLRIVAHLQETGLLQKVVQTGMSSSTAGVLTGIADIAQSAIVLKKLNSMQAMMGTIQALNLATLASSVVGIGVTAASTAMILHRIKKVDKTVLNIENQMQELPAKWREMALNSKLVTLRTTLERIEEAEVRPDAEALIKSAEEKLTYVYDELYDGLCQIVIEAQVDANLIRNILEGLSLCGAVQIKSLLWLNMKNAAEIRARKQTGKLERLAFLMPRDLMAERISAGADEAAIIAKEFSEARLRIASQPSLMRTLAARNINGREYIERLESEETEPYLLLTRE